MCPSLGRGLVTAALCWEEAQLVTYIQEVELKDKQVRTRNTWV